MNICESWDCGFCYDDNADEEFCVGFSNCPYYTPRGEKKMKRYKLKIPEMIRREDARIAETLEGKTGRIIEEQNGNAVTSMFVLCLFRDIPKDWLEEIKDEPVSAEAWARKHCSGGSNITAISYEELRKMFKQSFEEGEANERLRHKPQQTFEEWLINETSGPHGETPSKQTVWEASEINRGFEPDRYGETCIKQTTKKDESISAEELLDQYLPKKCMAGGEPREYNDEDVICIIKKAEANERLRHRPQQTFEEWFKENATPEDWDHQKSYEWVWNACLKSHNLEDIS